MLDATTRRKLLASLRLGVLALPPLAAGLLLLLSWKGFLDGLDGWMRGRIATWSPGRRGTSKVALVLITNDCLDRLKRWPLRRRTYARAIRAIRAAGARVIAVDVLFLSATEGLEEDDELLRKALADAGNVVLPCLLRPSQILDETMNLVPRFKLDRPWPPFAKAAAATGFANMEVLGLNGLASIERAPLELLVPGETPPLDLRSFALEASRLYLDGKAPPLEGAAVLPAAAMRISDLPLPTAYRADLRYGWIDYRPVPGGEVFPTYTLSAVIDERIPPGAFREKLVFLGTQATGTEDFKITPLGPLPGVAINACVAHGLLHGSAPRRVPPWAHPLVFLLGTALGVYLFQVLRRGALSAAYLVLLPAGALGGSLFALARLDRLVDPSALVLLPFVLLLARIGSDRVLRRVDEALETSWTEEHDDEHARARRAFENGNYEEAEAICRGLRRRHGERAAGSAVLQVRALLRLGRLAPARQALQDLDLERLEAEQLRALGRDCLDANLLDSADGLLSKAYLHHGDEPDLRELLEELARRRTQLEGGGAMPSYSSVFDPRYEDVVLVGRGGMAIVYRAFDKTTGRIVALKLLSPVYKDDRTVLKRFMREVEAVDRLEHPNVVQVFEIHEGELPYFSMEFLSGASLRKTIDEDAPLPLSRALALQIQLLEALAYANGRGVIHRDVKPENMVIEEGDRVKLVDFGLARLALLTAITQEGASLGTPWYMSPEQFQGKAVDGRSDLYSAGVVLYEMLSGDLPYPRDSIGMQTVLPPTPIAARCPELQPAMAAFVMRCIAARPEERFAGCDEALQALVALRDDLVRGGRTEPSPRGETASPLPRDGGGRP